MVEIGIVKECDCCLSFNEIFHRLVQQSLNLTRGETYTMTNRKQRRAQKSKTKLRKGILWDVPQNKPKFEGFPYKDYTVGVTKAAQAAIEIELAAFHTEHSDSESMTVGEFVKDMATLRYQGVGLPSEIVSAFPINLHRQGRSLMIGCDQVAQFLTCWLTSEQEDDKRLELHLVEGHIAQSFLTKYLTDERILH